MFCDTDAAMLHFVQVATAQVSARRGSAQDPQQDATRQWVQRVSERMQVLQQNSVRCASFQVELLEFPTYLRHRFKNKKVASDAASLDINRSISDTWKELKPEEKADFERKAVQIQMERDEFQKKALSQVSSASDAQDAQHLNREQIKRLNHQRLSKTLQDYSKHPCWEHGLGLSDHISALKASLVLPQTDENIATVNHTLQEAFSYDCRVVPNANSQNTFIRGCGTVYAGTCKADCHFDQVRGLASEFQSATQKNKLGAEPFMIQVVPLDSGRDAVATESWFVVAGVCLRPLLHSLVYLHKLGDLLKLSLSNGRLRLGTFHRVMRALLQAHVAAGGVAEDFSARAPWPNSASFLMVCETLMMRLMSPCLCFFLMLLCTAVGRDSGQSFSGNCVG